jgi:tyrosine-protein phosphatase
MIGDFHGPVGTTKPLPGGDVSRPGTTLQQPFESYHQQKESVSTSASTSAESSPTTTASIIDDSSATEMSPGSSPESPLGKPYPSSFGMTRPHTSDNAMMHSSQPFFELQRSTTPGRKGRNLKNLAVNTSGAFVMSRAASTTSLPMSSSLDSTTNANSLGQSFSKPPSLTKRRSSKTIGLTILTPANNNSLPQNGRAAVPPTPSFARPNVLRHFQSSPSLPLHIAEEIREEPLLEAQPEQKEFALPLHMRAPLKTNDSDQNFDVPQSKEEKPEAYPDGPICVYGRYLDLYLEPTAEQASQYDVILNVASEVKNPFDFATFQPSGPELRLDGGGGIQYAPKRNLLASQTGFGRENLSPVYESSPTTPKANSFLKQVTSAPQPKEPKKAEPEYIHIPWEHNTDIVPDLVRLVKVVDERIQLGQRVLIHCQCGVSRSATLVVAYVLYKNPSMSVQEAYDDVKKRSRWIGPNMNLIMQLQEFRSTLQRPQSRFGNTRGLSPNSPPFGFTENGRPASYDGSSVPGIKSPKTAPLPPDTAQSKLLRNPDLLAVSPGPSSAPSGLTWPTDEPVSKKSEESTQLEPAYVDPNGRTVPVVQITEDHPILEPKVTKELKDRPKSLNLENHIRQDSGRHITPMVSPRATEFAMAPLRPSKEADSADQYGLMSPRASEFSQSPFDRESLLGALGMGSAVLPQLRPQRLAPSAPKSQKKVPKSLTLRPEISAPSLSEQQELQNMQSKLEAELTHDEPDFLDALASPRAFEFTQNPFASLPGDSSDVEKPTTTAVNGKEDPRSPPQKGAFPIQRNIFDVL